MSSSSTTTTSRKNHAIIKFLFFWGLHLTVVSTRTTTAWVMITPSQQHGTTLVGGRTRTTNSITTTTTSNKHKRNKVISYHSHQLASTRRLRALDLMSDTEEQQQQSAASPRELVTDDESINPMNHHLQHYQNNNNEHSSIILNHPQIRKILAISDEPTEDELSVQQKIINLLFLSAAFGYAIYTIFNIDNGMTRGWTVQEQVMRIPLDNWGAYESYLANKPVITKTLINVIIYLLGDWLSQTVFQKKHVLNFDISRTLRNGFIGLCFGPLVHQYYEFSDAILPPENGMMTRVEKIFMDQTIYLTVKCSIYISAVGLLAGEEWPTVKQTVKDKIGGIVLTAWKFWPIVHCITYSLIPAQHRILWVNCVDLVWNAILASKAQRKESVFEELEEENEIPLPQMTVYGEPLPPTIVDDVTATTITTSDVDDDVVLVLDIDSSSSSVQVPSTSAHPPVILYNDTNILPHDEMNTSSNTTTTTSFETATI